MTLNMNRQVINPIKPNGCFDIELINCFMCGKGFWRRTKAYGGRRSTNFRKTGCVTCSSMCSRKRVRLLKHAYR